MSEKPCPVTQIQAYRAYEKLLEIMENETDDQTEVFSTAYKALYWIANDCRAQPANDPLTLEQLREMVDAGEWAWVEMNYGTLGWCKPFQKHPFSMRNVNAGYVTELDFERGFVVGAYRRKPEGSENE